ncbi:hypothetical protein PO903_05495 [Paenibacillus sp. PK4536]|uniref:hypothetical protein n=1 Tax=Paenibacillus sp. PK4536 TaxID=3024576 RepID=UPI002358969C|nr:hypothetical protein [Paenibacillus sp. PK4536]WIM40345.1 hypothetical protein PO903_05495 [Paenibacillus sp. PK4536]
MEDLICIENSIEKILERKNPSELKKLQAVLNTLHIKTKATCEQQHNKTKKPGLICPICGSKNTTKHDNKPSIRIFCHDCKKPYVLNRHLLHFGKKDPLKLIELIIQICTTSKSSTEIISYLNVSSRTYYIWSKQIISVFPQLESRFKNRRKKCLSSNSYPHLDNFNKKFFEKPYFFLSPLK